MSASYDPWSTHLPALALAVMRYGRRVLEIGCGWYSTPMLYTMSHTVETLETDYAWASKFFHLTNGHLHVVPDIEDGAMMFSDFPWDVVFVDCDPVWQREPCVRLFLDKPCCVVAHDTEAPPYPDLLPSIRYQRHFDFVMPRTSFLSNVLDVTK